MFVSHVSNKYGAGRSLLGYIDGLLQKGVHCYVIMPREGLMAKELENREVEYSVIPLKNWVFTSSSLWKRGLRSGFNLLISLAIAVKARAWRADVLYTNSSTTPVGALAALLLRKPHVWHIREFGREDYALSFDLGERVSMKLIERLSFRVIVISEALKEKYIQHISPDKIQRIYNPVEEQNPATGPGHVGQSTSEALKIPSLTIVGLLHPGKGQLDAVLAVGDLIRQGVYVRLRIVGDGDPEYLKQLGQAVVQNGIEEYVEFMGYMDDPIPIMKSADIILVCSRAEAFGRVTVEGMLCGKPIIGARSGATPELVKDGSNGLLYEPGSHQDLAEKIKYLIDHHKDAKQMGANGFEWASKEFTIEKCASQVFDVLQKAMKAKCRRGKKEEQLRK